MVEPGSISRSDDFTFRDLTISAMQHRANHDPTGHGHRPRGQHAHQRGHRHDHTRSANPAALRKVLALTGAFLVAEVVGGLLTGSLALLSDAAHMFTDTAALAIALATARIAERPAELAPHLRLPALRDPGRDRERGAAVRRGRLHSRRGLPALHRAAGDCSRSACWRSRPLGLGRQPRGHAHPVGRAGDQRQHARGLSGGVERRARPRSAC